ncbi:hypothetical protein Tco_0168576 [Tanacetum coccineum]
MWNLRRDYGYMQASASSQLIALYVLAIEEYQLFTQELEASPGWVVNKDRQRENVDSGTMEEAVKVWGEGTKKGFIREKLQRLYKSSHTAKEMIWHATGKCTEPGLAADGFNPFDNLSQAYSMWPVILMTYNLPPWLCMKERSFILTLLIPGPKSPGKDIDVYLRPLIEDLKVLWDRKGVETIDVASGQKFNMSAMVLWTINDFPAQSSLSGWSGQGYKACPTCNEDTPSVRVLSKTAYVGHIRFLKKPHKWRSSLEFNGQTDNRDPPKEFV